VKHATTHRAATNHPKVYLLHQDSLPGSNVPDNSILETEGLVILAALSDGKKI
jgi:hypothetical protein